MAAAAVRRLLPALGALALVAPGALWAWLDHHVWPWDQAQYAQITLRTLNAFRESLPDGIAAMDVLLDYKAPGLTWLGVPYALLGSLTGRYEPALLGATLTWQFGTLLACFWSAYLVSGSRLSALALAVFLGSTPLFVSMSHQFLVEPLQTFAVALSFLLALRAPRLSPEALYAALCAAGALAMAAKTSSPLYCALPLLIGAVVLAGRRFAGPASAMGRLRLPVVFLASGAFLLVAAWYVSHFSALYSNVRQSTVGDVALNYGRAADFGTKLHYWTFAFERSLVLFNPLPLVAALAGAAGGLLLARRARGAAARSAPPGAAASPLPATGATIAWVVGAAATHLIAAFTVYSLQINEDIRFLEPVLPASVIVLAWLLRGRLRPVAGGALLGAGLAQFVLVYSFALGWSAPKGVRNPWLSVVERDDTHYREMQAIVALTCRHTVSVVGVGYPWLSDDSANFYATVAGRGTRSCIYSSLGYALKDLGTAIRNVEGLAPSYFITVFPDKMAKPDFLNRVSAGAFAYVSRSQEWQRVRTIDDTVVIFHRVPR